MSWRRFMVLVRGLGPESATVAHLSAGQYEGRPGGEPVNEQEAENALATMFRRPSVKVH